MGNHVFESPTMAEFTKYARVQNPGVFPSKTAMIPNQSVGGTCTCREYAWDVHSHGGCLYDHVERTCDQKRGCNRLSRKAMKRRGIYDPNVEYITVCDGRKIPYKTLHPFSVRALSETILRLYLKKFEDTMDRYLVQDANGQVWSMTELTKIFSGNGFQIFVELPDRTNLTCDVNKETLVSTLMTLISIRANIRQDHFFLLLRSRKLWAEDTVEESGMLEGDTIRLVLRLPGGMPPKKQNKKQWQPRQAKNAELLRQADNDRKARVAAARDQGAAPVLAGGVVIPPPVRTGPVSEAKLRAAMAAPPPPKPELKFIDGKWSGPQDHIVLPPPMSMARILGTEPRARPDENGPRPGYVPSSSSTSAMSSSTSSTTRLTSCPFGSDCKRSDCTAIFCPVRVGSASNYIPAAEGEVIPLPPHATLCDGIMLPPADEEKEEKVWSIGGLHPDLRAGVLSMEFRYEYMNSQRYGLFNMVRTHWFGRPTVLPLILEPRRDVRAQPMLAVPLMQMADLAVVRHTSIVDVALGFGQQSIPLHRNTLFDGDLNVSLTLFAHILSSIRSVTFDEKTLFDRIQSAAASAAYINLSGLDRKIVLDTAQYALGYMRNLRYNTQLNFQVPHVDTGPTQLNMDIDWERSHYRRLQPANEDLWSVSRLYTTFLNAGLSSVASGSTSLGHLIHMGITTIDQTLNSLFERELRLFCRGQIGDYVENFVVLSLITYGGFRLLLPISTYLLSDGSTTQVTPTPDVSNYRISMIGFTQYPRSIWMESMMRLRLSPNLRPIRIINTLGQYMLGWTNSNCSWVQSSSILNTPYFTRTSIWTYPWLANATPRVWSSSSVFPSIFGRST